MNKLQPYALVLGLGAVPLGCATTPVITIHPQQTEAPMQTGAKERNIDVTIEEVMRVLGVRHLDHIQFNLPDGYKTLTSLDDDLGILTGIYAGTVDVRKTEDGYFIEGYSGISHHKGALSRVLQEADRNEDRIITRSEMRTLKMRLYEEYAP
ncbi:hypothetical protein HYW21_06595 [Candidatus Woesearchaeota archaeon]|nr:hypothetical protein [Candidatus Woesearchaeota archaeon]